MAMHLPLTLSGCVQVTKEVDIPIGSMSVPDDAAEMNVVVDRRGSVERLTGALLCSGLLAGLIALTTSGSSHLQA
jgi:hypothetical protein